MASSKKLKDSKYNGTIKEAVQLCEAMRKDTEDPQDISLADYFKESKQITMDQLYEDLGISPSIDTIQNVVGLPSEDLRWLIPEIYRDALRLGLRKNPIYPGVIAGEQSVKNTTVNMPAINMSDATPMRTGVAQTIKVGEVSFDQKKVEIHKIARGIKVPYEVTQYVSLNLVSIFMQDFGVKMGMGIDSMMIDTILNGDQLSGADSAAVIGIDAAGDLVFRDLLRIWVRGARLGKKYGVMIAGEDMAMDIMELLVNTRLLGNERVNLTLKQPMPTNSDLYVHGSIPTNQVVILDPSTSIIKLNAQPLLVESEKIISNQTSETFASLTTGFGTMFRDSRIILDKSIAYSGASFPSYMDPTAQEAVNFG